MKYLQERGEDVWLQVHVQPGAKNTAWAGEYGERIKIRLNAPPVEGRANLALTAWLAKEFGFAARDVSVIKGETSRGKTVCFTTARIKYEQMRVKLIESNKTEG